MADYNINAITRRVVFSGSAGLGPYAFTFEILDENDIAVYFNATKLTITTDYTVTINANGTGSATIVTGGSVPSTPTASDSITIVGARDIERTTDFVTAGDLRAAALNEQLDGQIIMIQQIAEENKRGLSAPVTDPALVEDGGVVDMTLPGKTSRAGKVLAFDSDGNPVVGEDIGNWRGDWAASTAYTVRDLVKDPVNESIYRVNTAHTSSGSAPISTNADAAKFDLVIDATAVADAEAAQAAAEAAQAAAETAEANAATSETNAASSASSASSSATSASSSASSASTSAATATTKAGEASTSAANASTSETNAASSASSASTSAATATTKAGEASTSAANASTSETNSAASAASASTSASNAATSESNAASSASSASTSASSAASSATAAASSAAAAAAAFDNFDDTYLGAYASNPTVDNDGDALTTGDLYFNTTANEMRVYDGAQWIAASAATQASLILYEYTATSGQTTFSGADDNAATLAYTADNIQVVMNGVILDPSDYTATNGTSVVLASGAALNDIVNIYAFQSFSVADTVSASAGGTFNANVAINGNLTVDTNTLYVDSANNRVGVGTSPSQSLHVVGEGLFEKTSADSVVAVNSTGGSGRSYQIRSQTSGDFYIYDNTAGSARVVVNSSGNVGIGTTSPEDFGSGHRTLQVEGGATNGGIVKVCTTSDAEEMIMYVDSSGATVNVISNDHLMFRTNNTERMRIGNDGDVYYNTTGKVYNSNEFISVNAPQDGIAIKSPFSCLLLTKPTFTNPYFVAFGDASQNLIGSITSGGTSVAYNTSSDYRLKENVTEVTGAADRVKALNPVRFNFISDPDTTVDGFLAHEVQDIVPEAITGTKNAVDDEGNPVYQGIDQSKLVPLLTAALQEALTKIDDLESRLSALETAQ